MLVISCPCPIVFESSLPRCASARVISANFFAPFFVNCIVTMGSFVCVSKSCRVPDSFRSEPVISGTVGGVYLKR